jgi:hypothetical protein
MIETELLDESQDSPLYSAIKSTSVSSQALTPSHYWTEYKEYTEDVSYQHHTMLWHVALANSEGIEQTRSLYTRLVKVKNLLLMNSLEITHWILSLDELGCSLSRLKPLIFFGFATKQLYCADLAGIEAKCETLIPNFTDKFRQWTTRTEFIQTAPQSSLNQKFTEITSQTVTRKKPQPKEARPSVRKFSEVSYKSDMSTEEDLEIRMETEMLNFEINTMKGEKLSPIDD